MQPLTMTAWRDRLLHEPSVWKEVKLPRADGACVRAVALRVQASQRQNRWRQPGTTRWLLIEQLADGTFKYHLSNLPPDTSLDELVRLAHQRWAIEQNYQQLKGTRPGSLRGPFLARASPSPDALLHGLLLPYQTANVKKLCSLPEVRRWLIEALSLCLCPLCQTRFSRSGVIIDSS